MTLREFLDNHWEVEALVESGSGSGDQKPLYLKDWHFVTNFPTYKVPLFPFLSVSHFHQASVKVSANRPSSQS